MMQAIRMCVDVCSLSVRSRVTPDNRSWLKTLTVTIRYRRCYKDSIIATSFEDSHTGMHLVILICLVICLAECRYGYKARGHFVPEYSPPADDVH